MKRASAVLIGLCLASACIGWAVRGDNPPKEETYVMVFYCLNAQQVVTQRQSGHHKIVVGYSLPSLTPSPDDMSACRKNGGVVMTGFVQVTPPFATLDEAKAGRIKPTAP